MFERKKGSFKTLAYKLFKAFGLLLTITVTVLLSSLLFSKFIYHPIEDSKTVSVKYIPECFNYVVFNEKDIEGNFSVYGIQEIEGIAFNKNIFENLVADNIELKENTIYTSTDIKERNIEFNKGCITPKVKITKNLG